MSKLSRVLLVAVCLSACLAVPFGGGGAVQAAGPAPLAVKQIASGAHHLLLLEDGRVLGWGRNRAGQLGGAGTANTIRTPTLIPLPGKAVNVAVSSETSYAVLDDGSVYAFGRGYDGQLGIGEAGTTMRMPTDNPGTAEPQHVVGVAEATAVFATDSAAFVLRKDGSVAGWGRSGLLGKAYMPASYGELAPMAATAVPVPGVTGLTRLSLSASHALGLTADGHVVAWGSNTRGELGQGRATDFEALPVAVPGLQDVVDIVAGGGTSAAVTRDGGVWVWGSNQDGHLANGTTSDFGNKADALSPLRLKGIVKAVAVDIGDAGRHTIVLLADGSLRAWGNSDWGQVGAGVSGEPQPTVQKPRIVKVKRIWATGNNSYALRTDGTFWMWGLGYGGTGPLAKNQKVPVPFSLPLP